MPLSDELQNLKDGIKSALDTSVEDGIDGNENTIVVENLATNLADAIQSYFLNAEVQTDDVVAPPLLVTTTAGPNAAPVLGTSIGEITSADYDFLKTNFIASYSKIQVRSSPDNDYKEVNRILGADFAVAVYGYFLSGDILTESTLEAFATLGVPPGVTPANMPAGEKGTGVGKNTIQLISTANRNSAIQQLSIEGGQYDTTIQAFTTEESSVDTLIVQSSEDGQIRVIAAVDEQGLLTNIDLSNEFEELNRFADKLSSDSEEDLGVTGLGSFISSFADKIKSAYNTAVELAVPGITYQQINQQLAEDIGEAIHEFATSSIIKIETIYEGGLGEDPPAGSSGATITATGNPAAPVTAPGAVGVGIGVLV